MPSHLSVKFAALLLALGLAPTLAPALVNDASPAERPPAARKRDRELRWTAARETPHPLAGVQGDGDGGLGTARGDRYEVQEPRGRYRAAETGPAPTSAPGLGEVELFRRYQMGPGTCGFASGYKSEPWTCFRMDASCVTTGSYYGCCDGASPACLSTILTTCLNYNEAPASCGSNSLCCASTAPSCFTWEFSPSTSTNNTYSVFNCYSTGGIGTLLDAPPDLTSSTSTSSASPSSSASPGSSSVTSVTSVDGSDGSTTNSNVGAIVGGAVAGLAIIGIAAVFIVYLFMRHRRENARADADDPSRQGMLRPHSAASPLPPTPLSGTAPGGSVYSPGSYGRPSSYHSGEVKYDPHVAPSTQWSAQSPGFEGHGHGAYGYGNAQGQGVAHTQGYGPVHGAWGVTEQQVAMQQQQQQPLMGELGDTGRIELGS